MFLNLLNISFTIIISHGKPHSASFIDIDCNSATCDRWLGKNFLLYDRKCLTQKVKKLHVLEGTCMLVHRALHS